MNVYILRPIHIEGDDPWEPWYDKCFGFIVLANNQAEARHLAQGKAGDEEEHTGEKWGEVIRINPWLDAKYSTCQLLSDHVEGMDEGQIIMKDFYRA